jgi:hypothetical protein
MIFVDDNVGDNDDIRIRSALSTSIPLTLRLPRSLMQHTQRLD